MLILSNKTLRELLEEEHNNVILVDIDKEFKEVVALCEPDESQEPLNPYSIL